MSAVIVQFFNGEESMIIKPHRMMAMQWKPLTMMSILLLFVMGCTLQGPQITGTSHLAYNSAVQESVQQELLLNLVRLRYTEPPEFLAISSISSQMSFDAAASVGARVGEVGSVNNSLFEPGVSVGYSERPTISFTPERGKDFTRQLVAPIELDSLYLLAEYGWGIDRVLRLLATELNGMPNNISRQTLRSNQSQTLEKFAVVADLWRSLDESGAVRLDAVERLDAVSPPLPIEQVNTGDMLDAVKDGFRYVRQKNSSVYQLMKSRQHYVLQVDESAWQTDEMKKFTGALGLGWGQTSYEIDRAGQLSQHENPLSLRMRTRSILGVMAYLSEAVDVPPADLEKGFVRPNDKIRTALSDLLRIRVSAKEPGNAALSVPYRGHWYYINASDLSSRWTMGLLTSLVRLEINTGGAQTVPILTIPISG
jgi:hypothetical protein